MPNVLKGLTDSIAGAQAPDLRRRFLERAIELGLSPTEDAVELGALLASAYPALERTMHAHPEDVVALSRGGTKIARDASAYRRAVLAWVGDLSSVDEVRRGLRRFANKERMRIAARELTPGSDVDITARELSELAEVCIEVALDEARLWAEQRFGRPLTAAGEPCPLVVIGMGKLGGRELNCGSDIDLLLFYETDEGHVAKDGAPVEQTLHEHFVRITQRFTETLDLATEDGFVWRVDLRLRPEGSRGPLVNALAAAERYYETWGRTWERAALVRARPVGGDRAFGKRLLDALAPFVWRRVVNPQIAQEMAALLVRGRTELATEPERDLKLGVGGIREAEFFVQSLQLIWGGREPAVRSTNTLDALRRLRARGLVTDREGREVGDAYLVLRRLEHRVQFATGIQTHVLPTGELLERIARTLGFAGGVELEKDLEKTKRKVNSRLLSLTKALTPLSEDQDLSRLFLAVDAGEEAAVLAALTPRFSAAGPDLARHMLALARRPDFPLGASTRDKYPDLAPVLIEALSDAADPDQATRLLAAFFSRLATPGVYARALAEDPKVVRRIVGLFGASVFLGEALVGHPELVDRLLFTRTIPDPASARRAVEEEIAAAATSGDEDPIEPFVGALRRAKGRVMMEVGLADLAGDLGTRAATLVLSELADATLEHATRFALEERGLGRGLAVIAMGKLGGREIGYGSDLDLFFVYENEGGSAPGRPEGADERSEVFVRIAQRVLRLVSTPHGDGPGYELDTRLRPSGNQGLLVASVDAFARYHGHATSEPRSTEEQRAEDWERQALIKARMAAGDPDVGAKVIAIANAASYERGAPPPERVHHLRMRMERELGGERLTGERARYDLKVGYGGLVDVEFAVQWLQMKYGADPRVRTPDTELALDALEACGHVDAPVAAVLREGYRTLRRLEQRLRVLHGTSAQLIEQGAPGLALLARRMGMRDSPRATAVEALLARYRAVTRDVRAAYLSVLGLAR